ncbi:histidine kinase [Nonomuraea sp. NPDC050310]|uniref:sensor histidine kinase n=1 Tax=Nonomuraea sp. NPDC050310 TaxID=3154935 RepID=UPI0033F23988
MGGLREARPGRLRRSLAAVSRVGDLPAVAMLAWAGWLAVPWPFAAAAARTATESLQPPAPPAATVTSAARTDLPSGPPVESAGFAVGSPGSSGEPAGFAVGSPGFCGEAAGSAVSSADPLAAERARLAAQVHDVAGHGFAAISLQAGIALRLLEQDPAQARASLEAIRATSAEALTRLRGALDELDRAPVEPGDLPRLLDGVRAAGLEVAVEQSAPAIPAHLREPVFGVVRESLTNVLRHAGSETALVRLAADPCEFVVEVADRGRGWDGGGEGRGLAGMRAQVTAAGGDFSAGPRDGGGFRVLARFPAT